VQAHVPTAVSSRSPRRGVRGSTSRWRSPSGWSRADPTLLLMLRHAVRQPAVDLLDHMHGEDLPAAPPRERTRHGSCPWRPRDRFRDQSRPSRALVRAHSHRRPPSRHRLYTRLRWRQAGARTRAPTRATGRPASFVSAVLFSLGLAPLQRARVLADRRCGASMRSGGPSIHVGAVARPPALLWRSRRSRTGIDGCRPRTGRAASGERRGPRAADAERLAADPVRPRPGRRPRSS